MFPSLVSGRARRAVRALAVLGVAAATALVVAPARAEHTHVSGPFSGVKVQGGTVTHSKVDGRHVLTLSDDFEVPDTPAPHWQVVDSAGNVYLLKRLVIKGDEFNKSIVLPSYVKDVAKVQIWCAWAEALLGEASFDAPQR